METDNLNPETREKVADFLEQFITRLTQVEYSIEDLQRAYPFHSLFFRDEAIIAFKRQRSIVTSLGQRLYPQLARIIAEEHYQRVYLEHGFRATVDGAVADTIERIVTELRNRQRHPNHTKEVQEILRSQGGTPREVVVKADLFIEDFANGPFFAEIKSPLPNLDIAAESKKKILTFIVLHANQNPQAYLAFPYNPFLARESYHHPFTVHIMDLEKEVLIGNEFWDKIGGESTYEQLLAIIERVKRHTTLRH